MEKVKSESTEQIEFVNWMRKNYPEHRIFAIPNGGARGAATAQRLKMEGVCAGVPDLFIPSMRTFIEMKKRGKGRLSPEQMDWVDYLDDCGYRTVVAFGADEAIAHINSRFR